MRTGFTLIEVVVALIVLQVAVLGVLGSLMLSTRVLQHAESLERATANAESVLDSLSLGSPPGTGSLTFDGGTVRWIVTTDGELTVTATSGRAARTVRLRSRVPLS